MGRFFSFIFLRDPGEYRRAPCAFRESGKPRTISMRIMGINRSSSCLHSKYVYLATNKAICMQMREPQRVLGLHYNNIRQGTLFYVKSASLHMRGLSIYLQAFLRCVSSTPESLVELNRTHQHNRTYKKKSVWKGTIRNHNTQTSF